jgi:hypothetical protein
VGDAGVGSPCVRPACKGEARVFDPALSGWRVRCNVCMRPQWYCLPNGQREFVPFGEYMPTGGWETDLEEDHGHPDYDRPMPGKRARALLKRLRAP